MTNVPLLLILHLVTGAALSGVAVVVALVAGAATVPVILGAALLGFVLAFPVSWLLARRLTGADQASR